MGRRCEPRRRSPLCQSAAGTRGRPHPGAGRRRYVPLALAATRTEPRAVLPRRYRRSRMSAYLSFEWLKLSKRWMPRVILLMMLALTILVFWGQATRIHGRGNLLLPRGWLAALAFCSFSVSYTHLT